MQLGLPREWYTLPLVCLYTLTIHMRLADGWQDVLFTMQHAFVTVLPISTMHDALSRLSRLPVSQIWVCVKIEGDLQKN